MPILEVNEQDTRQLQGIATTIASAKKVVVITGAGISTNCGIPDFRSKDGLYNLLQEQYREAITTKPPSTPSRRGRPSSARLLASPTSPRTATLKNRSEDAAKQSAPTTPSKRGRSSQQPSRPLRSSASLPKLKGKDLFSSSVLSDPLSASVFYRFIASLRRTVQNEVKNTSPTHRFIRTLRDRGSLLRCYTQNIDGLEARNGLCTNLERGKGSRARFTKKALAKPKAMACWLPGGDLDGGCEVVALHGDLDSLRCNSCQGVCSWEEQDYTALMLQGKAPPCPACKLIDQDRRDRGKRGTGIGTLRPNVVLYGEEHPRANAVGTITANDLTLAPDTLLILGTSLHVHGLKTTVKEFAKSVRSRAKGKPKVIFVNLTKPSESEWKGVIDTWVAMDCDDWARAMKRYRPDIWQVQKELGLQVSKSSGNASPQTPKKRKREAIDSEQENMPPFAPQLKSPLSPKRSPGRPVLIPRKGSVESASTIFNPIERPSKTRKLTATPKMPLQLPTPPTSRHTAQPNPIAPKRRASEVGIEIPETPSKRRKKDVVIWVDDSP